MSRGYNKVTLIGTLDRDPIIEYSDGKKYAKLILGTEKSWYDKNHQLQTKITLVAVSASGSMADNAQLYLKRGRMLFIEGHIYSQPFTTVDGAEIWATVFIADNIIFMSSKPKGTTSAPASDNNLPNVNIPF